MPKSSDPLPANENGHIWEFIPYGKGADIGSYRCSLCITSYDLGHGRRLQCDKGESLRRDVKKSLGK